MTNYALHAYEILTPNMECEIKGAEGTEADEMQAMWEVIGKALRRLDAILGVNQHFYEYNSNAVNPRQLTHSDYFANMFPVVENARTVTKEPA